jgi:hypothetical protein
VVTFKLRRLLTITIVPAFAFLASCGGGSSPSGSHTTTGNNVQSIAVNGGPVANQIYPNGAFTSVTICVPGTSNCTTVDGILVDIGSVGLRVLATAIPSLTLPQLSGSNDTTYYNCVNFVDGSYLWGPVEQADIEMADEKASTTSIQVMQTSGVAAPSQCSTGTNVGSQAELGANGILGVGSYPQDCGSACQTLTTPDIYFTCGSSGACASATISVSQQVTNPIVNFATDNNGVIIELPSVDGEAASTSGSMIFGIGTESNNGLGSATVFTLTEEGFFTTNFNSQTLSDSFIDSGSNGYFFPDSSITQCAANSVAPGFYCPSSTLSLTAQNVGANATEGDVGFEVDNAVNDFNSFGSDAAFANLAGTNGSDTCAPSTPCGFDWGLPFFYGRHVYSSIYGQSVPSGAPAAPWWAY